jgi:hypothetical protein
MIIGIDFDGTCVTHEFPNIGKDIGAISVLKELVDKEHQLILFTMRSNVDNPQSTDSNIINEKGNYLDKAVKWFKDNDIPLYGVNTNPTQHTWTKSPKAYCQLYIDDAGLGIPLKVDLSLSDRPFVDWNKVREVLIDLNIL